VRVSDGDHGPGERRPAFPDGAIESFSGDWKQMRALGATVPIRNALEDWHGGTLVDPGARVRWSGGACSYGDAARITPRALAIFASASNAKLGQDLSTQTQLLSGRDPQATAEFGWALLHATKWSLPEANPDEISRLAGGVLDGLAPNALRKAARTAPVAKKLLHKERFIADFFAGHAEGNPEPAEAARRGEQVHVDGLQDRLDWGDVSHISDPEMMRFCIGLADHVYAVAEGIDEAAFRLPSRRARIHAR
jgi:hypothetical protein